ncbi:hypothetical protein [Flaviaesturariibacter terrae]
MSRKKVFLVGVSNNATKLNLNQKMKHSLKKLTAVILVVIFCSCTSSPLLGKKLYTLNANLDRGTVEEYELDFISGEQVQLTQTVYCNSFECVEAKSGTKSIVKHYTYSNDILQLEGASEGYKLELGESGEAKTGDGFIIYNSSVAGATQDEKKKRLMDVLQGNSALVRVFLRILNNKAPQGLIEKRGDRLIFNTDSAQPASSRSTEYNSSASALFGLNTPSELIEHFGQENVKKRAAGGFEGQNMGYEYCAFEGTIKESVFYFAGDRLDIIRIKRKASFWVLPYNLKIGMSPADVQKINEREFLINSLETDADGLVLNWKGGKLENCNISVQFAATGKSLSNDDYDVALSEMESSDVRIKKLGLVIKEITISNPLTN